MAAGVLAPNMTRRGRVAPRQLHFDRIFGLRLERPASPLLACGMVKSGNATRSRPLGAPRCLAKGEESQSLQDDLAMPLCVYVNTSKQVGDP
jgi:hypothetical protein